MAGSNDCEELEDSLEKDLDKLTLQPKPVKIYGEVKPGYFYRVKPPTVDASSNTPVIGVYTKSVKYCDIHLTSVKKFDKIRDHVFGQQCEQEKNYLGVLFYGIWSYPEGDDIMTHVITIPIENLFKKSKGGKSSQICIWKTGHPLALQQTEEVSELKDAEPAQQPKFQYKFCKGEHTEQVAMNDLKDGQDSMWDQFIDKTKQQKIPTSRVLECIGLHFISRLDACDMCLHKLLSFKQEFHPHCTKIGNNKVKTLCHPVPLIITFTAKNFYNPSSAPYENIYNNGNYCASLLFKPINHVKLLRLGEKLKDGTHSTVKERETVKHQDTIELKEEQELMYIALKVDEGLPGCQL